MSRASGSQRSPDSSPLDCQSLPLSDLSLSSLPCLMGIKRCCLLECSENHKDCPGRSARTWHAFKNQQSRKVKPEPSGFSLLCLSSLKKSCLVIPPCIPVLGHPSSSPPACPGPSVQQSAGLSPLPRSSSTPSGAVRTWPADTAPRRAVWVYSVTQVLSGHEGAQRLQARAAGRPSWLRSSPASYAPETTAGTPSLPWPLAKTRRPGRLARGQAAQGHSYSGNMYVTHRKT